MSLIRLNEVLLDYLTLTSFDSLWFDYMERSFCSPHDETRDITMRGYSGKAFDMVSGTMSFLVGTQKGMPHYMVSFSGQLSSFAVTSAIERSRGFDVRCSRMDVQITVAKPDRMSMFRLLTRLKREGKNAWYPKPSRDANKKKLETVYVGEREKSDRFYRFYVKALDDGSHVLRCEVELKRRRSRAVWLEFMKAEQVDGAILDFEVKKMVDMDGVVSRLVNSVPHGSRVMVRSESSNTINWLLRDVMPVLRREALAHDGSYQLIDSLYKIIDAYEASRMVKDEA